MSANHEQGKQNSGFKIDSALIHAATTSDLQNELSGLGVSVFDQNEFEEGVLDQIDKEFTKRAVEQQKKFLVKEHSNVKKEIITLQDEIKALSKTICSLLSRPLCDVVGQLREVKASQEQKKKQLQKLQARDKELSEKIAFQPDGGDDGATPLLATPPASILPVREEGSSLSHERLVQLGHLTPFGTAVEELSAGIEGPASLEMRAEEAVAKTSQPGPASILPGPASPFSSSDIMSQQMGIPHDEEGKEEEEEEEEEEGESLWSEEDEYMPTPHEIASSYSEHFSEGEELAPPSDKKGKKRLREVHSDDSEDDLVQTNWPKRKISRSSGSKKKTLDDGDEEMYQLRIRKYEELKAEPAEPDAVFNGGFHIPGSIWHKLYKYQQTGVRWLWELHGQQTGGIVGDEMGLGKTIQMIAFLAGLNVSGLRSDVTGRRGLGPVLILCPATVMHQWVCEFHKWWPPFRVAVLHGTGTFSGERQRLVNRIIKCNGILLTTYAGVRIYKEHLLGQKWDYLVLDEGHKIRNPDADVTIVCKQFTTPHRILLSGSPMQNNLRELWSLFDFVFPGKLGTLPVFMEQFSVPITLGGYANATEVQVRAAYKCACVLRDSISPYLLRRLKADVKIQLPDKNEQVLFCRLTDYQREIYQDFINSPQVLAMLAGGKQVFSGLVTLRKLCNHPDLVTGDYSPAGSGGRAGKEDCEDFIKIDIPKERRDQGSEDEEGFGNWRRAGKMIVVESLLKLWKAQNHRVLLFTQGRQMLDILEQFVSSRGYTYQRMDGCTSIASRQPMVNKFNEDDSIFVFLLTTRVGGLGVNLIGADRVLIYDPDWNPSTDTQARERAWRIGQTRPVTIYRLLCSGTIEEKIYHRQIFKQFLTNRVLKDPRQRRFFKSNDLHELFTLGTAEGSTTDTGAIFAGTHSEQIHKNAAKRKHRTSQQLSEQTRRPSEQTSTSEQSSGQTSTSQRPSEQTSTSQRPSEQTSTSEQSSGQTSTSQRPSEQTSTSQRPSEQTSTSQRPLEQTSTSEQSSGQTSTSQRPSEQTSTSQRPSEQTSTSQQPSEQTSTSQRPSEQTTSTPQRPSEQTSTSEQPSEQTTSTSQRPTCSISEQSYPSLLSSASLGRPGTSHERPGTPEDRMGGAISATESSRFSGCHDSRRKKSRHRRGTVDGVEITGVERTGVFECDDQQNSQKQDDFVLKNLFKRTGVQSAMHHDVIMNSADPDYVLVEAEAKAAAQSASKVLKESRKQCMRAPVGWPTWTGQHGIAGAPKQRFGPHVAKQSNASSSRHFDGELSQQSRGSLNTSSGDILAKIKSRNVHILPPGSVSTSESHRQLLTDIRNFIATQCKVAGQATTKEILTKFQGRLPTSDTAVFRSMLHEICNFSRHHGGEGLWQLKPEFR